LLVHRDRAVRGLGDQTVLRLDQEFLGQFVGISGDEDLRLEVGIDLEFHGQVAGLWVQEGNFAQARPGAAVAGLRLPGPEILGVVALHLIGLCLVRSLRVLGLGGGEGAGGARDEADADAGGDQETERAAARMFEHEPTLLSWRGFFMARH